MLGAQVYGEDMAILAGDAMLTRAFEYIARETKGVPAERTLRVRFNADTKYHHLPSSPGNVLLFHSTSMQPVPLHANAPDDKPAGSYRAGMCLPACKFLRFVEVPCR